MLLIDGPRLVDRAVKGRRAVRKGRARPLPPPSVLEHPLNILGLGQSYNSFPVVEPVGELHCYGS